MKKTVSSLKVKSLSRAAVKSVVAGRGYNPLGSCLECGSDLSVEGEGHRCGNLYVEWIMIG